METKRKLRLIVLDGEVTLEDLLKLKQGGFFEGVLVFEVPEGLKGQVASLGVPASQTSAAVEQAPKPAELAKPVPAPRIPEVMTAAEAEAFAFFEERPVDVVRQYAAGTLTRDRNTFTEQQITDVLKARAAIQSGKRPAEAGIAWFQSKIMGLQPTTPAPTVTAPAVTVEKVPTWERLQSAPFIEQLNSRKYLRQIVSDMIDIGITTRDDILKACQLIKDRVPRIADEGTNIQSRIDITLAAIHA